MNVTLSVVDRSTIRTLALVNLAMVSVFVVVVVASRADVSTVSCAQVTGDGVTV